MHLTSCESSVVVDSTQKAPLGYWQAKVWDPAVGSTKFDEFCAFLDKPIFGNDSNISLLPFGHEERLVDLPGGIKLDFSILNYADYIKEVRVPQILLVYDSEHQVEFRVTMRHVC